MIHKIFTVFDEKAQAYIAPFTCHQTGMAIRSFTDACADQTHKFGAHPEDYTLYQIGFFDDETAEIYDPSKSEVVTGLETRAGITNLDEPLPPSLKDASA